MPSASRQPSSNQPHLHPRLARTVHRHLARAPRKPMAAFNLPAFARLQAALTDRPRPLVLDSFCGTGHSTAELARRFPAHLVVGVDQSADRLSRHPADPQGNYLLLQADCAAIWQLLATTRIAVEHHYLLYPNPWPKAKHLQRRVHGCDAFYWFLQLAKHHAATRNAPQHIEVRSNWQTYVEEFGVAMLLAGYPGRVARVLPEPPLSLFERKYRDSGHPLWAFSGTVTKTDIWAKVAY